MIEKYSFDEFKLMYQSTEKVTDRRLTNNKLNYSISIAVLVSIGIIWKWSIVNEKYFFCGLLLVFVLDGLAVLFCSLWIGQIKDFKKLNSAKFDVINEMCENLYFVSNDVEVCIKSYKPFAKEWEYLTKTNALQEAHKGNIISLNLPTPNFLFQSRLGLSFLF